MTIEAVATIIKQFPDGAELVVAGDFNYDLAAAEGSIHGEKITAPLSTSVLEDTSAHLLPWINPWLRDRWTWSILLGSQEVCSWTDNILVIYRYLLQNVLFQYAQHSTDH